MKRGRRERKRRVTRVVDHVETFGLWIIPMPVRTRIRCVLWYSHSELRSGLAARSNRLNLAGDCRSLPAFGHVQIDVTNRDLLITRISQPNAHAEGLPGNSHERLVGIGSNSGVDVHVHCQPKCKTHRVLKLLSLQPKIAEQLALLDGGQFLRGGEAYKQKRQ